MSIRTSALLFTALLASSAAAQVVIPPHASVYTGFTRGYNFVAATNFNIVQLELPLDAYVTGDTASFAVRVNLQPVFHSIGTPGPSVPCNIPVLIGDMVDVVGNWSPPVPGTFTGRNSYGNTAPFATTIEGVPHTLYRQGVQNDIGNPAWVPGSQYLSATAVTTGQIGRVIMHTSQGQTGTLFATATSVGSGCVAEFASIYEDSTAFDLSNTSLGFQFLGNGYAVLPGTTAIAPQTSAPVVMGDDQVLPFSLGFAMPYPGGVTTDVWVSSNGFVNLTNNTLNGCCAFSLTQFLTNGPVFAAKWRDLNPSAGGTVQFDSDPANGLAYVTFTGVPDYAATNTNDFQYVFSQSGVVELRFGNVAPTAGGTGYSPGANNLDPGSTDLSALVVAITGQNDIRPLALSNGGVRPIASTSMGLITSNLSPSTLFGAVLLGFNNPAIDLSGFGMAGCTQYSDGLATLLYVAGGAASVTTNITVPNLLSLHLFAQSVAYDPASGRTTVGAIASNGIDLMVGDW